MSHVVLETRIDIRRLAECALAFEHQHMPIKSKSGLVAACVEALADILKSNGVIPQIDNPESARLIVDRVLKPKMFNAGALTIGSIQQQVLDAVNNLNPDEGD